MASKDKPIEKEDFTKSSIHAQYGHRTIFKAMGFTSEELALPRIAIVNSWSEQSPGHSHLRTLSEGVKAGIRMAGGMPFEINVIGPCTVLNGGGNDILYDLPQREAILASIESALKVGYCHGWVGIGSCDKIVPGMLLAALRLDRPFIFLGGGQMLPADYDGERFGFVRGMEMISQEHNQLKSGEISEEDYVLKLEEYTDCCGSSAGACGEMTTGNSMQLLTEALGFSIPRSSTSLAVSAEKIWQAKETGKRAVDLAKKQIKPSEIFTMDAMKNAMAVEMAICGGTNSMVHLQSCVHEAQLDCTLDMWDDVSRQVPAIVSVAPSGPHVLYDFHREGGIPVVMKNIEKFLIPDCLTVTGQTVGENIAREKTSDSDVIRSLDNPVWEEGALVVLKGNLAPVGAVTRHTVVDNKAMLSNTFNARVFNTHDSAIEAIAQGKISANDVIVCRYQGPRGGPAMRECLTLVNALKTARIKDVVIITDGRFSGWTKGYLAIGNLSPEAQIGGPLALVEENDRIQVDIQQRVLHLDVSDEVLAERKSKWQPPDQSHVTGTLLLYAKTALQAEKGGGWPVRWDDVE